MRIAGSHLRILYLGISITEGAELVEGAPNLDVVHDEVWYFLENFPDISGVELMKIVRKGNEEHFISKKMRGICDE